MVHFLNCPLPVKIKNNCSDTDRVTRVQFSLVQFSSCDVNEALGAAAECCGMLRTRADLCVV